MSFNFTIAAASKEEAYTKLAALPNVPVAVKAYIADAVLAIRAPFDSLSIMANGHLCNGSDHETSNLTVLVTPKHQENHT